MAQTTTSLSQASAAIADDIHDIRPPITIPTGWEWAWWTLGALVAAGLIYWLIRYLKKRLKKIPVLPTVPAHLRARHRLEEALGLISQPKPFCTLVSDTIRQYLEERYDFHAPERTTEEFLYELRGTNLLAPDQKDSLGGFLQECDLVKFSKYEPGESELQNLHASALRLVEETEPTPLPQSTQQPEAVSKS